MLSSCSSSGGGVGVCAQRLLAFGGAVHVRLCDAAKSALI